MEKEEQLTTKEARQSVHVPGMRHVLGIGIAGTAIGFLIAWLIFAY